MTEVSAGMVKALRDKTNAGMMDCKRALSETGGDLEAAVDWLRKKGLSAAAKRSGRVASEGLIGLYADGGKGAVVEINSETDFVARNALFQAFVGEVAHLAVDAGGDQETLLAATLPSSGRSVKDEITNLAATIGENITFRRVQYLEAAGGIVASYLHSKQAADVGRIGVLVAADGDPADPAAQDLARKIAMHVAAANPLALSRDAVPQEALDRERAVLSEQARASGKPEAVIAKMVEGRLGKFYEDVCLLDQPFVMDPQSKVSAVIAAAAKELKAPFVVRGFVRFSVGEGAEKNAEAAD